MERSAYSVDSHRGGIQLLSLCVRFVVLECVDRNVPSVCLVSVFNCRVATKTLTSLYISMKRPSPWQFFACHMPLIDTRARVSTATGQQWHDVRQAGSASAQLPHTAQGGSDSISGKE